MDAEPKGTEFSKSHFALLALARPSLLDAGNKPRGRGPQGVADPEERIESGRFLVVLQHGNVRAIHLGLKRQGLLRQAGRQTLSAKFLPEHSKKVAGSLLRVG